MFAVKSLCTVSKDGKVAADALPCTNPDVRKWAAIPITATIVCEMDAKRCTFGLGIVRQVAGLSVIRAGALEEFPANRDLLGIMLVWARKATCTRT